MTTSFDKYKPIYTQRGIWELWHDLDWQDYTDVKFRNIVKGLVDDEVKENVLLHGLNGTGKSMLMNIAMKEFVRKGKEVYVIDFRNLVREYIKSWKDDSMIPMLLTVDYLAIDDLGKEFQAGGVSKELAVTALDYVLRYRFQRKKSTWLTFNMKLTEIATEYTIDISSLLKRSSIALHFEGEDYGKHIFKKISSKATEEEAKTIIKGNIKKNADQ